MSNDMGTGGGSGQLSCPRCGCELEISTLLRQQLEGEIQTRLRGELGAQLEAANQEAQRKLAAAAQAEAGVLKQQRALEEREQQLGVEHERRINEAVGRIREQELARVQAQAAAETEAAVAAKEAELVVLQARLADATRAEAGVLKRQRELEEREQRLGLEAEQKIQAEVARIRAQEQQRAAEQAAAAAIARAAEAAARDAELQRAREMATAETAAAVAAKEAELVVLQARVTAATQAEAGVLKRERELAEREQQLGLEAEQKIQAEVAQIRAQEQQRAEDRASVDRAAKDAELAAMQAKLAAAVQGQAAMLTRERELAEREQQLGLEAEQKIQAEVARIREQEQKRATEAAAAETATAVAAKEAELVELQERLTVAAQGQVAVLRRERELAEREQELQIAHEHKLMEEGRRVRELAAKQLEERLQAQQARQQLEAEEQRLKTETLQRKIDELQRSVAQGSQQTQGEAQEVVLRDQLATAFPQDDLGDVGKGVLGADVVQRVRAPNGGDAQIILWESKRTKGWSNGWIPKLREDQAEARAAIAVIVTQVLPPGVEHFGQFEGIWVCAWAYAVPLAAALRSGMIELAQARRASEGRGEKMEMLYAYLTGPEFRLRVTGLVEALKELESDLRTERSWMMTRWKKREKQLLRAQVHITSFSGDLAGIGGANLPAIELLELGFTPPALEAGDDDEDADEADDADPDALAAARPEDPQLVELMLELLPPGGGISNHALSARFLDVAKIRSGLVLHAGDYERCKRLLIAAGRARRGKGRGGSVARITPEETS